MIRWYADNSELRSIWGAKIPDILLYGGIVVDEKAKESLCSIITNVKSAYRKASDFPIKWCFKDLESYYRKRKLEKLYNKLLQDSQNWRREIFTQVSTINFTAIIATIISYGSSRETLLRTRSQVARFVFVMGLQRYGLFVQDHAFRPAEVVLDWPAEGKRNLFDVEFKSAFQVGASADYEIKYKCGPLKKLGFQDSIFFSSTAECSLLQLSDLIVGATRDLIEEALGKKQDSPGMSLIKLIRNRFRGAPDNVVGRGIAVSPTQGEFFKKVKEKILEVYL